MHRDRQAGGQFLDDPDVPRGDVDRRDPAAVFLGGVAGERAQPAADVEHPVGLLEPDLPADQLELGLGGGLEVVVWPPPVAAGKGVPLVGHAAVGLDGDVVMVGRGHRRLGHRLEVEIPRLEAVPEHRPGLPAPPSRRRRRRSGRSSAGGRERPTSRPCRTRPGRASLRPGPGHRRRGFSLAGRSASVHLPRCRFSSTNPGRAAQGGWAWNLAIWPLQERKGWPRL